MDQPLQDSNGLFKSDAAWHQRLEDMDTVHDVLNTVRDYLATLTPAELARLPENRRPGRVKGDDDIEYWTFKLSRAPNAPIEPGTDLELMQNIFHHFLHASVRISQIHKAMAQVDEPQPH